MVILKWKTKKLIPENVWNSHMCIEDWNQWMQIHSVTEDDFLGAQKFLDDSFIQKKLEERSVYLNSTWSKKTEDQSILTIDSLRSQYYMCHWFSLLLRLQAYLSNVLIDFNQWLGKIQAKLNQTIRAKRLSKRKWIKNLMWLLKQLVENHQKIELTICILIKIQSAQY